MLSNVFLSQLWTFHTLPIGELHCTVLCHNPARPIARRLHRKDSAAETAPHPLRCANFLPFTIRGEATWRCASTSASIKWRTSPAPNGAEAGGAARWCLLDWRAPAAKLTCCHGKHSYLWRYLPMLHLQQHGTQHAYMAHTYHCWHL